MYHASFPDLHGSDELDDLYVENFFEWLEAQSDEFEFVSHEFSFFYLVWPERKKRKLHESVPNTVGRFYLEALRVKDRSPSSFAVQIRRSLEAICKDRGVQGRNLDQQLKQLTSQGIIPSIIAEIADELRLLGNIGAHADDLRVTSEQVQAMDDFFHLVIEYVYIAPHKLKEFRNTLGITNTIAGGETVH